MKSKIKCPLCDFVTGPLPKSRALRELINHIYYQHEQNEKTTYLIMVLIHAREFAR
jgi:hypothetical protein